jgi:hypothetical protein
MSNLAFDFWMATATIDKNSYVKLSKNEKNRFRPEAMLSGALGIKAGKKGMAAMEGVKFSNMHITTEAPYLSIEKIGYSGSLKLGGFPLSVNDLEFTTTNGEAKLGFNAKLSLMGDKSPIAADTYINVTGTTSSSVWRYKTVEVSNINLDVSIAEVFHLQGILSILDDDPVYGNGFAGKIDLNVIEALKVKKDLLRAIPADKANKFLGRIDLTDTQMDKKVNAIIDFFEKENNFNKLIKK